MSGCTEQDEDVVDFPHPTLEGGKERWKEKYAGSASRYKEQFFWAARSYVEFVLTALGANASNPTTEQLSAAFDTAAKRADGTDDWPFDELIGSFRLGTCGARMLSMLHDVWIHGPAMREWWIRRLARCPAEARDLATRPVEQLIAGPWHGPAPERWIPFALKEGAEWEGWKRMILGFGITPWCPSVVTAFVAQVEANLTEGMPFTEAAEKAHGRVIQIDYRPKDLPMADYKDKLKDVAHCLWQLHGYWPRFAELCEWACASSAAEAYGTNKWLKAEAANPTFAR